MKRSQFFSRILALFLSGSLLLPNSARALRPSLEGAAQSGLEEVLHHSSGLEEFSIQSSRQLELERTSQLTREREFDLASARDWFDAIVQPASEWQGPELVYYPYEVSHCSFGHAIRWAFVYLHPATGRRVVLGQDEIVSFGVVTEAEKDQRKRVYEESIRQTNEQAETEYPYLITSLTLLKEQRDQLLSLGHLTVEDQLKLKALAQITAVEGYRRRINIFDQRVVSHDQIIPITVADIDRYMALVGEYAAQGLIHPEKVPILQTELQRLRRDIAVAVSRTKTGDFSEWERIAARYSYLVENMSTFSIKIASLLRFASLIKGKRPAGAKPPEALKRWGFFGGGSWITVRGMARIRGPLSREGIDVLSGDYYNIDGTKRMPEVGQQALAALNFPVGQLHAFQVNMTSQSVPLEDNFLDVAEIGVVGTIGDGTQALHLWSEIVRAVAPGGYILVDVKNKPLPQLYQATLERFFPLKILTDPLEHLGYDNSVLSRITRDDSEKTQKIKSHLQGASCVVAVKLPNPFDEQRILRSQESIVAALQYDDSYEAQERRGYVPRQTTQLQEVDLSDLDYDQAQSSTGQSAASQGIPKADIRVRIPDFEMHIDQLERYRLLLFKRRIANRGLIQDEVQRLLVLWFDPEIDVFQDDDAHWLEAVYQEGIRQRLSEPISAERISEVFPNIMRQCDEILARIRWGNEDYYSTVSFRDSLRDGKPVALILLDNYFEAYIRIVGMPFERADRWYEQHYPPQPPNEMIPTSLYGHLHAVRAYAQEGLETIRVSSYIQRLESKDTLWTSKELAQIHEDFLLAMSRDTEWERQAQMRARGKRVWSLRNIVLEIRRRLELDRFAFSASYVFQIDPWFYKAAYSRIPGGWNCALFVSGFNREEIERYQFEIRSHSAQRVALMRGLRSWTKEAIEELILDRFDQGESLLIGFVNKEFAGAVSASESERMSWGSWEEAVVATLMKYRNLKREEAAQLLEQQRSEGKRRGRERASRTLGHQVWTPQVVEELILNRFDHQEPLMRSSIEDSGFWAAIDLAEKTWDRKWDATVVDVLIRNRQMTSEQALQLLEQQRTEARKRGFVATARTLGHQVWTPQVVEELILNRFDHQEPLMRSSIEDSGFEAAIDLAEKTWDRKWDATVVDVLIRNRQMTSEQALQLLEQQRVEALRKAHAATAKTLGHKIWTKPEIEGLILNRFDNKQPLIGKKVDRTGFDIRKAKNFWDDWNTAVIDTLVRHRALSREDVVRLLAQQRSEAKGIGVARSIATRRLKQYRKSGSKELVLLALQQRWQEVRAGQNLNWVVIGPSIAQRFGKLRNLTQLEPQHILVEQPDSSDTVLELMEQSVTAAHYYGSQQEAEHFGALAEQGGVKIMPHVPEGDVKFPALLQELLLNLGVQQEKISEVLGEFLSGLEELFSQA